MWMCACCTAPVEVARSSARNGSPGCSCAASRGTCRRRPWRSREPPGSRSACVRTSLSARQGRRGRHAAIATTPAPPPRLRCLQTSLPRRVRLVHTHPAQPRFERKAAISSATRSGCWSCGRVAGVLDDRARAPAGPCRRSSARRARSPRRGRPRSPAAAARSVSSSCQTGSSTPCPAVRSSMSERSRVLRQAPGALLLDQGVRLVREQRLALPDRDHVLDRRRLDPGGQPLVGLGAGGSRGRAPRCRRWRRRSRARRSAPGRAARRAAPAGRRASSRPAARPRRPPRSPRGGPRRSARDGRAACSDSVREELGDRRPGVAALHEARDEQDRRAIAGFCRPGSVRAVEPINRTYAPLQAFVDELVRCGMRHAVTCPGSRNAPLVAHARRPGRSSRRCR